ATTPALVTAQPAPPAAPPAPKAQASRLEALETLTAAEADTLEAIVARLIPSDANGPGAARGRDLTVWRLGRGGAGRNLPYGRGKNHLGGRYARRCLSVRTSLPPDGIRKTLSTAPFENPINTRAGFSLIPHISKSVDNCMACNMLPCSLGQIEMPDVEQARGVVREGQHGLADGGKSNPRASASRWAARMGCGAI